MKFFLLPRAFISASKPILMVLLFVLSFSSHWIIFHSFGELTIADEGLQILPYSALIAIEQ